jgi:peptidase E
MATENELPRRTSSVVRRVFAMGGGGFSMEQPDEPHFGRLDRCFFSLARRKRPRVLFVPTASGDAEGYLARFYESMRLFDVEPGHLSLFRGPNADVRGTVLDSDVVYVGGGNTRNLLALWREWGLDVALREAYEKGVVLGGVSAGAIAWFQEAVTDSVQGELRRLPALGWLPGAACPHFDGEPLRRPECLRFVAEGMPETIALDDGAAALFENEQLVACVASLPGASAWRVRSSGGRGIAEALPTRLLTKES